MIMECHHANRIVLTSNLNKKTIPESWTLFDAPTNVFWGGVDSVIFRAERLQDRPN